MRKEITKYDKHGALDIEKAETNIEDCFVFGFCKNKK